MAKLINGTRVVTNEIRASYVHVAEPVSVNGSDPKYSMSVIISKDDKETLTLINKAIDQAITDGIPKFGGKRPNKGALKLPLRDGDVEKEDEAYQDAFFMTEAFKIGNMGGMRRSKTTGTLVLISDNTKGLYHDKWKEGVLHYTGMGKTGDQVLTGNQNRTLAESGENGIEVHLFEVIGPGKYSYTGVVELAGKPYQETQPDDKGNPRLVWIFPLRKVEEGAATSTPEKGRETREQNENPDDYGVKEQSRVYSKFYGEGVVTRIVSGKIYVDFEGKKRIFNYPDAFNNGWLTI